MAANTTIPAALTEMYGTLPDVGRETGCTYHQLYNLLVSGRLDSERLFGRLLVRRDEKLASLIRSRTRERSRCVTAGTT